MNPELGIHDAIQYLNSKFLSKPLSEVRLEQNWYPL